MNKLFYIAYDLIAATREQYDRLDTELRRLGASEVLRSDWVLRSSSTAMILRDHLLQYVHASDRLVVLQVNDWASYSTLASLPNV